MASPTPSSWWGTVPGRLYYMRMKRGHERAKTLIEEVQDGYSLGLVDFNDDGYQDIFTAEMRFGKNSG